MSPYPADSKRELSLKEAVEDFEKLEKKKETKWIAGRIMSIRGQGAIIFLTLNDGTASFQGLLKKDILGEEKLNFLARLQISGTSWKYRVLFLRPKEERKLWKPKTGVCSQKVCGPLPEKWHGLTDVEERFRKRYLDILMNPEVKDIFEKGRSFGIPSANICFPKIFGSGNPGT